MIRLEALQGQLEEAENSANQVQWESQEQEEAIQSHKDLTSPRTCDFQGGGNCDN